MKNDMRCVRCELHLSEQTVFNSIRDIFGKFCELELTLQKNNLFNCIYSTNLFASQSLWCDDDN